MKYCQTVGWWAKDMLDCTSAWVTSDLLYEMHATTNSHLSGFTSFCRSGNNVYYCDCIGGCQDCFGCTGMNNQQYCILNKQYTKEEYEALVPKIIEKMMADGEWGEFFSPKLSPFWYNHSIASEYYPLEKDDALSKGFNWTDYENPRPTATKTIPQEAMKNLPDTTEEVPDDILDWLLTCEISSKPYKLIKQELDFYRKHNLPIPRRHPDQRHKDRMELRNPRKLFERTCDKCSKEILTVYSPERPEIVYCEECYNEEIV